MENKADDLVEKMWEAWSFFNVPMWFVETAKNQNFCEFAGTVYGREFQKWLKIHKLRIEFFSKGAYVGELEEGSLTYFLLKYGDNLHRVADEYR